MKSVRKYYALHPEIEWKRLDHDALNRLEFNTTMYYLKKYLPKKGLILDAGGGPGRYTVALAKMGYNIVLLDLVKENLLFAKRKIRKMNVEDKIKDIIVGDITDLSSFKNNYFDAVICLGGPLSHILKLRDREKAVSELKRVAKQDAPIFVSVMGKHIVLIDEAIIPKFQYQIASPFFKTFVKTGNYYGEFEFTAFHGFTYQEFKDLFEHKGLRVQKIVGLEGGLGPYGTNSLNKLEKNKKAWKIWLDTHYKMCEHPSIADVSCHILIIGRKI
jgi:ubiquinone/menaquinone biosynthesis C-methylase UbiE